MFLVEFLISEKGFDDVLCFGSAGPLGTYFCRQTDLAIVESSFDSDIMNVRVRDRGHLSLLNRRNSTFWVEDED